MSKLVDKLIGVKGKLFIHQKEEERILDYTIENDIVTIITSKGRYIKGFGDVIPFLADFLPIDESAAIIPKNQLTILNNSGAENIRDILMDNINKVRANKDYVHQARQINNDVNTLIELAKTEIELLKISR